MRSFLLIFLSLLATAIKAQNIKTHLVEYKEGEAMLEGYLAYDASLKGKRPVVIVAHEWTGINEYTKKRCDQLASMGYIAFAADIYGKAIRPQNPQDAGKEAGKYKNDRVLLRKRMNAALARVKEIENADASRIVAIGYCFGGTAVLELARSGADVAGVVSFHGGLDTPDLKDASGIKAKVLVCHGAIDPYVPQQQVDTFLKEMNDAKVDYQLIAYSNAVHSFTNPGAGNDNSKGAAYNKDADARSWEHMKLFMQEIFGK